MFGAILRRCFSLMFYNSRQLKFHSRSLDPSPPLALNLKFLSPQLQIRFKVLLNYTRLGTSAFKAFYLGVADDFNSSPRVKSMIELTHRLCGTLFNVGSPSLIL